MRDFHIKAQVREKDREGGERKKKRECKGERMGRRREEEEKGVMKQTSTPKEF